MAILWEKCQFIKERNTEKSLFSEKSEKFQILNQPLNNLVSRRVHYRIPKFKKIRPTQSPLYGHHILHRGWDQGETVAAMEWKCAANLKMPIFGRQHFEGVKHLAAGQLKKIKSYKTIQFNFCSLLMVMIL